MCRYAQFAKYDSKGTLKSAVNCFLNYTLVHTACSGNVKGAQCAKYAQRLVQSSCFTVLEFSSSAWSPVLRRSSVLKNCTNSQTQFIIKTALGFKFISNGLLVASKYQFYSFGEVIAMLIQCAHCKHATFQCALRYLRMHKGAHFGFLLATGRGWS